MSSATMATADREWPTVAVHSGRMGTRGQRILRERTRRRMSRLDLRQATGVSERTISRIEKGEAEDSPSAEFLEYYLGIGEEQPSADVEEKIGSPPVRPIEHFTLMELLAEAVRRVAQIEARTGERMNGGEHMRIKWPTSAAPPAKRDWGSGSSSGGKRDVQ